MPVSTERFFSGMGMNVLELFSGSGSVGKSFTHYGASVTSLDIDPKTDAIIKEDILTWDYTVFPPGFFDVVWASPVCTQYSIARRNAKTPRNLDWADTLVKKSLEIIQYFQPRVWFIENPASGMLKDRPFMEGLPFSDVDYCRYCDWGYRKRTRLWNNCGFVGQLCGGPGVCPSMEGGRHKTSAQQGRNRTSSGMHGEHHSTRQLYRIPEQLCDQIVTSCITVL